MKTREGYYSEKIRDGRLEVIFDNINRMQYKVLKIIENNGPLSNEEIALIMKKYPHEITPRVKELREKGLVEYAGEGISKRSGAKVSLWKEAPPNAQTNLF